jgi:O-succinylbenzoate synthase
LIGQDIHSGKELQEKLTWVKGNFFAKAGFDLAWWDLYAKLQNKPLWQIIGGKSPEVEAGTAFGILDSIDTLLEKIDAAVNAGFKRIKLKYSREWGLEIIRIVRSHFPKETFHIDCNSSFSLDDLQMFKDLDRFELAMIEQPLACDDLLDHAKLQSQIETPICLDESITSPDKARKAIQIGACRWINIKLGRCGGITNALEICRIASEAGIPCWVGAMLESALGQSHSLSFATLENIKYPSSISPSDKYYRKDLCMPPMMPMSIGKFKVSNDPGVGVVPDPEMLASWTKEKCCF